VFLRAAVITNHRAAVAVTTNLHVAAGIPTLHVAARARPIFPDAVETAMVAKVCVAAMRHT
jgi:hypothetical protein